MNLVRWLSLLVVLAQLLGCAPAPASVDCADVTVFCVGLVTESGKVSDPGLNRDSWQAILQAQEKHLIDKAAFIETVESLDLAKNVDFFLSRKYDLVVTVGSGLEEISRDAAGNYPDVLFIGIDQSNPEESPNMVGVRFPEDQGGFMAGALAALVTQTGVVGAACESDYIDSMWRYCEGFRAGATYANAMVSVIVQYRPSGSGESAFRDEKWGAEAGDNLTKAGADVVFGAGGDTAESALEATAKVKMMVIGGGADILVPLPELAPQTISCVVRQVSEALPGLLEQAADGTFSAPNVNAPFAFTPFNKKIPGLTRAVKNQLLEITRGLADGTILTNVSPEKPGE